MAERTESGRYTSLVEGWRVAAAVVEQSAGPAAVVSAMVVQTRSGRTCLVPVELAGGIVTGRRRRAPIRRPRSIPQLVGPVLVAVAAVEAVAVGPEPLQLRV